jgi:hypothetical protein
LAVGGRSTGIGTAIGCGGVEPPSSIPRLSSGVGVRGRRENELRRTIKLTDRQAEIVTAMFVGNDKDGHYKDDEIRELVTLIWEWQWGIGRSVLESLKVVKRAPDDDASSLEAAE